MNIPVSRPLLPSYQYIKPYIEAIDEARWYSNEGPMVTRFEARMADTLALDGEHVVMLTNGTLGLTVALQAHHIQRGALCLLPSWTFTATVSAVLAAGLTPYFMDVDKHTQAISPALVEQAMNALDQPIGAVVPVAPWGNAIDTHAWDRWSKENNVPCIIDAAAAFDAVHQGVMSVGDTPIMISLHATKVLGIGEGGLLLTKNADLARRLRRIINFGFEDDRHTHRIGINAKPSEYAGALAMAALDVWPQTREGFARTAQYYAQRLSQLGVQHVLPPSIISSTYNIMCPENALILKDALQQRGIDCRRWWEAGCHTHPAYRSFKTLGNLPNTRWLHKSVLGIPMACDMNEEQVAHVCDAIAESLDLAGAKKGAEGTTAQAELAS